MPLNEQRGVTQSERYLGKLCRTSFLSLWSYQNVFTDRGANERNRQGKELCDLLVIFENDIIIFSDKFCEMPNTGEVWLDWSRWYKRAIAKSASQIFGAERWLVQHPDRVFLDAQCQEPFPLAIPSGDQKSVHRVVVAMGSEERVEKHFGGNSRGSLMLASWLRGEDHTIPGEGRSPFTVGHIDSCRGFVHVFDDVTLDIVMNELDTISDFVQYLSAKAALFETCDLLQCAGEEDFLGFYLQNLDDKGNFLPDIVSDAIRGRSTLVHVAEGIWDDFSAGPTAAARREFKQAGQFIDNLIEHISSHVLAGILTDYSPRSLFEPAITRRSDLKGNRHERRKARAIARKK